MTTREKAKERLDYRQTEEIPAIESRKALLAWGGVGPDRGVSAAHNLETITNPPGRPPAVGAFSDFTYHGGPVVAYPQVYVSFWGALWTGDEVYKTRAQRLTRFHQDLLKSDFMNVLSQYGVGTGAGSGVFVQSSFLTDVPVTLNEQLVRNTIQSCINSKVLPEPPDPSNNILVIYLDETVSVKDLDHDLVLCESGEDAAFGYHSFFRTEAGNPCYYAVIPALTDQDVQNACRGKDGSLYISAQQEQRLTQVASHTFAELTTDPELNAWFDPKYGESGDICNGEPDVITLGANQWVVQRIYSKFDDVQTGGATYSLSQAASSRALLSPGPVARPTMIPGMQHIPSYDRLLPFPSMYVDGANEEVSMDAQELHNYVMGMFHPLRAEHIIADLPRMLRAVTSVLETEEERNTRHIVGGSALSREEQQDAAFNLSLQHADLPRMLREVAAMLETEPSPDTSEPQQDSRRNDDTCQDEAVQQDEAVRPGEDNPQDPGEPILAYQEPHAAPVVLSPQHHEATPAVAIPVASTTEVPPHVPASWPKRAAKFPWFKWLPTAGLLLIILLLGSMIILAQTVHPTVTPEIMPSQVHQPVVSAPAAAPADELLSPQQLDQLGWTKAGLSQSDAVAAQQTASSFVEREMSYDYRNIGTPDKHAGTLTAATFLLTPGARVRFQQNDVRMIDNTLYNKIRAEQIIRRVINTHPKLIRFEEMSLQQQPHQFAWFNVSFAHFQSNLERATGKRVEGLELDPTSRQPRAYQMMVVLMHVPSEPQNSTASLENMDWLVNAYDLSTEKPLAIETSPAL